MEAKGKTVQQATCVGSDGVSIQSPTRPESQGSWETVEDEHSSYLQFVRECAQVSADYEWLQDFLGKPGPPLSENTVTVLDCVDGELFETGRFSKWTDEFSTILKTRPSDTGIRLIVVEYHESWLVDKQIVDELALTFDVDPDFLRCHFYYHFIYIEEAIKHSDDKFYAKDNIHTLGHTALSCVNDDNTFHLAATRSYEKLSAYMHHRSKTMLIFVRSNSRKFAARSFPPVNRRRAFRPSHKMTLSAKDNDINQVLYAARLKSMSNNDVLIGSTQPAYFLLPYSQDLVKYYRSQGDHDTNPELESTLAQLSESRNDIKTIQRRHYQLLYELGALSRFQRDIELLIASLTSVDARAPFARIEKDILYVRKSHERSLDYFRELKNEALLTAQMAEAQASTDAALSVNRLSRLAFFFIPLSFTTSLFGMNVVEFGQGTLHLHTFFITAVVIGICTVIPLWLSIWTAVGRSGALENARIMVYLTWHRPSLTLWYMGLCARFEHAVVMGLCGNEVLEYLGLEPLVECEHLEPKEVNRRMRRSYYSGAAEFWEGKAEKICSEMRRYRGDTDNAQIGRVQRR